MKIDPDLYDDERTESQSALRRAWNTFVRIVLVIFFAILLGVGLYLGVPALIENVINPVQDNVTAVEELEDQVTALESNNELSESQLRERLVSLEAELADQAETIADLQADLGAAQDDVEALTGQVETLSELADQVDELSETITSMTGELDLLDQSVTSVAVPASALEERSQIVLSMIVLTRARLWMEEDNLGLAAEDITAASDILEAVSGQSEGMDETLGEVLDRLDNALEDVRRYPRVAANELEIAWKLLIDLVGQPAVLMEAQPTPTLTATPSETPSE
jgi:chromosome segregation ATPase